jgi:HEAT repeat protein
MSNDVVIVIIGATIAVLLLLIAILLFASVIRRLYNERKYRTLDALRDHYDKVIQAAINADDLDRAVRECAAPPNSNAWQAVEDVLMKLIGRERHTEDARQLFARLGYITHYEEQLANKNVHVRSMSIDKLGRTGSTASVSKLAGLLDAEDPEIVSITVRTLNKIGGEEALLAISKRLPSLLDGSIVAGKTVQTALLAFGPCAVSHLVEMQDWRDNPGVISSRLEILSRLPAEAGSARLAIRYLSNPDAEVRSKALKVLGRLENNRFAPNLPALIIPLLDDPVWFVRLQAIRSAGALKCTEAAGPTARLIYDRNWQVRNEAARAVILQGQRSLDVMLEVLSGTDRYAKDSVCEEIEKTGLSAQLIENLNGQDPDLQTKSRQILEFMRSLGFSATLEAYRGNGAVAGGKNHKREPLKQGTPP